MLFGGQCGRKNDAESDHKELCKKLGWISMGQNSKP